MVGQGCSADLLRQGRNCGDKEFKATLSMKSTTRIASTGMRLRPPPQVPEGTAPDALAQEVVGRAAAKVQRLLQYRSLPGGAGRQQPLSSGGSARAAGSGGMGGPQQGAGIGPEAGAAPDEAGLLLERRLLSEVEAARERCKRGAILARLQAELPACLVSLGLRCAWALLGLWRDPVRSGAGWPGAMPSCCPARMPVLLLAFPLGLSLCTH